jgi:hypothetical protein
VSNSDKPITPLSDIETKRRNARSIAIAGGLIFLVILFYLLTIFKMGAGVVNKSL